MNDLKPEALLFQTGYITIRAVSDRIYTLGYPNREVKAAFLENLLHSYAKEAPPAKRSKFTLLANHLYREEFHEFFECIAALFAAIPYTLESKRDEAYFHTMFYLMISASSMDARSEVLTCKGRIDLVIQFSDKIFVIEFKCDQNAETAIKQILEKGYATPYADTRHQLFVIGINFSTQKHNVSDWKVYDLKHDQWLAEHHIQGQHPIL